MTSTQVRAHSRRKPERQPLAFADQIEARKAILAAKFKSREEWSQPGYKLPRLFSAVADAFRSWRA